MFANHPNKEILETESLNSYIKEHSQPILTCSISAMKTPEQ